MRPKSYTFIMLAWWQRLCIHWPVIWMCWWKTWSHFFFSYFFFFFSSSHSRFFLLYMYLLMPRMWEKKEKKRQRKRRPLHSYFIGAPTNPWPFIGWRLIKFNEWRREWQGVSLTLKRWYQPLAYALFSFTYSLGMVTKMWERSDWCDHSMNKKENYAVRTH